MEPGSCILLTYSGLHNSSFSRVELSAAAKVGPELQVSSCLDDLIERTRLIERVFTACVSPYVCTYQNDYYRSAHHLVVHALVLIPIRTFHVF